MASFIAPHLPVLMAPFESLKPPKARAKVPHFSEKPDARMWAAITSGDEEGLRQALKDGAKANFKQNATPPLWAAVEQGKLNIAKILLEYGADPTANARGGNVWRAIAKRNDPQEAEQLKNILGTAATARPREFVMVRSYKLVEWWVAQNHPEMMTQPDAGKSSWEWNYDWVIAAAYGPAGLWDYVSKAWGIVPNDPQSLSKQAGSSTARGFWEDIIRRDNVPFAQECLQRGWGPPEPSDYKKNYSDTVDKNTRTLPTYWKHDLGWAMLDSGAENLWAWWSQIPGTLERMQAQCLPDNDREGTTFALLKNEKKLLKLESLGLFHPGPDQNGTLLAHEVFSQHEVHPTLIKWWAKNRPEDFKAQNKYGHNPLTPVNKPGAGGSNAAVIQKVKVALLEHGLPEADTTAPARARF